MIEPSDAKPKNSKPCKYITMVSRRAAGVWTHLPSLTYSLLAGLERPRPILWVDFGLRYEMFNHLRINPARFPERSSLLGLIEQYTSGGTFSRNNLISYKQTVIGKNSEEGISIVPVSEIRGPKTDKYREHIARLSSDGQEIYMIPLQVPAPHVDATGIDLDVTNLEKTMDLIVKELKPVFTFLTFEGQPEGRIFARKITEDKVLGWGLDVSETILSLVRFDSEQRFKDSISIPTLLSRHPDSRKRLRLVLNRVLTPPNIQPELKQYVLGNLPFAEFIAVSVNAGRIPIIDIWCRQVEGQISKAEENYMDCCDSLSKQLATA
jgi:hypothetical protein